MVKFEIGSIKDATADSDAAVDTTTVTTIVSDLDKLINGLQDKSIGIATVAENLKCSFGFVQKLAYAPIPKEIYDPEKVNRDGILKVLAHVKLSPITFSMDGWTMPERKVKVTFIFELNGLYKLPKSCGKQSPECIYKLEWINSDYGLFVPYSGFSIDDAGFSLKAPRAMGLGVAGTLDPSKA